MVSNLIFHFFCCARILGLSFRLRKIVPNGSGKDNEKIYKYYSNNVKPYNFMAISRSENGPRKRLIFLLPLSSL